MRTLRCVLTGVGNIGRSFLEMLPAREALLRERYALELRIVGLADSSGTAYHEPGFASFDVVAMKQAGRGVVELEGGVPGGDPRGLLRAPDVDLLLEATPTNLRDGEPGLGIVRTALERGIPAVLASKGPLVLAYAELEHLSDLRGPGNPALRFSGAVGGALPSINLGRRDLAGSHIRRVEAVLNGTTQVILSLMSEGQPFPDALAAAQAMGIVEPDPSLDVDGWDAASKLVILANAVLRQPVTLDDVRVTGIRAVTREELDGARATGGRISVMGLAEAIDEPGPAMRYHLSVAPTVLPAGHPLADMALGELGIVYTSDIAGRSVARSLEDGPVGSCAAMLRDVIAIFGQA